MGGDAGGVKRALAVAALCALALFALPARATVEEFSSFDVFAPEEDDEYVIDHFLARTPVEWRAVWDTATAGARADQGCLTSALWFQSNEMRGRSNLGRRTWLDVDFLQHTDAGGSWQWLQFDVHRRTARMGTWGARVRPAYDKSQQDFALLWDWGGATSPLRLRATFTLEDAFNSFWEFKQERVGDHAEPYRRHPVEPAIEGLWRGPKHRLEWSATWLTPSRKRISDPDPALNGSYALWGSKAHVLAERTLAPATVIAGFDVAQARSARAWDLLAGDGRLYRRQWSAEFGARRALGPRLTGEARYVYGVRDQAWGPPVTTATFRALDRVGEAEVRWRFTPDWLLRTGVLYDRIGVSESGALPGSTWGRRKESRAFLGLEARFEQVRVQVIEGIELDAEPYDVAFHHDKGFLHVQTTF